jgi:hypothetical protein
VRNAICFAATEDFMVLRHAVTPGHQRATSRVAEPAADVAPVGGTAEEVRRKRKGKLSL